MIEPPATDATAPVDIIEWLADAALTASASGEVLEGCCRRLRAQGVAVIRCFVTFRTLHPLYAVRSFSWTLDGLRQEDRRPSEIGTEEWRSSPLRHVLEHELPLLRRRLTGPEAQLDFPMLRDFVAIGGTDYVGNLIHFEGGETGLLCSWLCGDPAGFSEAQVTLLCRVARHLAIAFKGRIEQGIAHNVAAAYLGRAAGQAVLTGAIRRGDGRKIDAVLWYADLRRSTALADRLSAEDFLQLLNGYFEATAGAVDEAGGEVVSLVGDAVLGLFPVEASPAAACAAALAAAREARRRLAALPPGPDGELLDFGLALHRGSVIHGNVGTLERLQFTLVGSAVNEVVRVQALTKELGRPVLATAAFTRDLPDGGGGAWRSLGHHALRGLETPAEILAPPA